MTDGTLETIDGRRALRFERRLPHSPERVWRAVTEPAELARWFVAPVPWKPELGETFDAAGQVGDDHRAARAARLRVGLGRGALPVRAPARRRRLRVDLHARLRRQARLAGAACRGLGGVPQPARRAPDRPAPLGGGGASADRRAPRALRPALRGGSRARPAHDREHDVPRPDARGRARCCDSNAATTTPSSASGERSPIPAN